MNNPSQNGLHHRTPHPTTYTHLLALAGSAPGPQPYGGLISITRPQPQFK